LFYIDDDHYSLSISSPVSSSSSSVKRGFKLGILSCLVNYFFKINIINDGRNVCESFRKAEKILSQKEERCRSQPVVLLNVLSRVGFLQQQPASLLGICDIRKPTLTTGNSNI